MARVLSITHVNAPPDRVFARMSDFPNAPDFIRAIDKVEMLTEPPIGAGARFKETRTMFGHEATETMEIARFEPGECYTLTCESCGCLVVSEVRCISHDDGGTRLEIETTSKPLTFMAKLMAPIGFLMTGAMRKAMDHELADIKRACEMDTQRAATAV